MSAQQGMQQEQDLGQRVVVTPDQAFPLHCLLLTLHAGRHIQPGQTLWCSQKTSDMDLNSFLKRVEHHRCVRSYTGKNQCCPLNASKHRDCPTKMKAVIVEGLHVGCSASSTLSEFSLHVLCMRFACAFHVLCICFASAIMLDMTQIHCSYMWLCSQSTLPQ